MVHLQQQNQYFWGTTDAQRDFIRERVFRTFCDDWKEKNFWERNISFRDRKWCDGYVDRL
ncbi:hypothetical protein AMC87_CH02907 [Rhizobium phaseoli]|uniref:hypothetical protein n=1 Tax=Rhizobium phaseoli TaxID=396 RepID=UPI0007EBC069|nr:hypothetical protein [Rhizobium phaseoli]ANL47572.1 hypothetical protein AMC87_CH02907 [Rhizobium phaseoli]